MKLAAYINQKSYEQILLKIRRHPVTLVPVILSFAVLLVMPVIVFFLIRATTPTFFDNDGTMIFLWLLTSAYYLSVALFYYTYFVNYYISMLIITNDRLMLIAQQGIFSRTISELDLYKIQDITSAINGFFPTLFNYGNLLIQTASEMDKFYVLKVPNPEHLRQQILDLAEKDRSYHNTSPAGAVTN